MLSDDVILANLSLEFYLVISYTDIFGNSRTNVYLCTTGYHQQFTQGIYFSHNSSIVRISERGLYDNVFQQLLLINQNNRALHHDRDVRLPLPFVYFGETIEVRYNQLKIAILDWFARIQ